MAARHLRQQDFAETSAALERDARESNTLGRALKEQYLELRLQLQPEIDRLQAEADGAAQRFRLLYAEASDAYASNSKAVAKALSLKGKREQAQCEHLNAQVTTLRSRLSALQAQSQAAFARAKDNSMRATQARESAGRARTTQVRIEGAKAYISAEALESFLDELPQAALRTVSTVCYDASLAWTSPHGDQVAARGMTEWLADGRAMITVGAQPVKRNVSSGDAFKGAVSHEIGHVCYSILSDEDKAEWFALHAETAPARFVEHDVFDDDEEDFAECFRFWATNKDVLRRHDRGKDQFINRICSALALGGRS